MRVVFIFLLMVNISIAQQKEMSEQRTLGKNNINVYGGWFVLIYGVGGNYQRLIKKDSGYYTLSASVNLGRSNAIFGNSFDEISVISISNGFISGIGKRNHFEANVGLGFGYYNSEPYETGGFFGPTSLPHIERFVIPVFSLGYRYQVPNEGFIFRTGAGFPEFLYIGIGVSF